MQCVRNGGEVIGVDLSHAVEVAQRNLQGHEKAHFVQADLFNLPFRKDSFDMASSIGVLMHTGNAHEAFMSMSSHLKKEGIMGISVYQTQNPLHEFNDRWIRAFTIRFSNRLLQDILAQPMFVTMLQAIQGIGYRNGYGRDVGLPCAEPSRDFLKQRELPLRIFLVV